MTSGLVVLALISAFVSAVETALFSLQPQQIETLKARRASFAEGLGRLMENPRRFLSAVLLADALANAPLMIGSLVFIEAQGAVEIPRWASVLIIFALIVFICDLVPKLIALTIPQTVARMGVSFFSRVMPLLDPLARVLERGSERIAGAILPAGLQTESEMISEIIKLGDKTAKDCMTPRVEMFALPDDLTNEEAMVQLRQRRFRRVVVYGETPDDIEGVLDVSAFLREPSAHYTERLDVPSFVPETMKAVALLKSFLNRPQGLAIVVDEHGGVEGVVTLADLVEEIISDAVPQAEAKLYLESIGDGRLLASGSARLEDIEEELGVKFEAEGSIDTIGGLIFNQLGQLPKAGQELRIGSVRAVVRRVSRKRVDEVQLERDTWEEVEE